MPASSATKKLGKKRKRLNITLKKLNSVLIQNDEILVIFQCLKAIIQ